MKTSNKIIWGIILLVAALGLLSYAVMPNLAIFTIPVWKWFILAVLLYWVIKLIGFGTSLANRLSAIFPLALIFIIFENEIANLAGLQPDFANRWIVVAGALLIVVAVQIIFSKVKTGSSKNHYSSTIKSNSKETYYGEGETEKSFSFGDSTCHIDASTQRNASISNSMGELNIFYQNIDVDDTSSPLHLAVKNSFGETVIHVPSDWFVDENIKISFGDVEVRKNADVTTRVINIDGSNRFGEVRIISD